MLALTPSLHKILDDRLVGQLKEKKIFTVRDFLRTDSCDLNHLFVDLADLSALKADLYKLVGISPINGFQHFEILTEQSTHIPTGIESLDVALNGGFLSGNIVDVCGRSASGKTQLYTTIALNWAAYGYETFVVDTKLDFSGDRINRMLIKRGLKSDDRKRIMCSIKVQRCSCPLTLLEILSDLLKQITLYPRLKLLVIDSLSALWYILYFTKTSIGNRKLASLAHLLRKLAVEHAIVVLTVNIETIVNSRLITLTTSDEAIDEVDANEKSKQNRSQPPAVSESTIPALGKYWKTICSFRLKIQRQSERSHRTIHVTKSNQFNAGAHCAVQLTDAGII